MDRNQLIDELQNLSARLDERAVQARRLGEENRSLRLQQEQLVSERSTLLAKNEQARMMKLIQEKLLLDRQLRFGGGADLANP